MTKDARDHARLVAHFRALDQVELPTGLSARLRTRFGRPARRRAVSHVLVPAATALVLLAAFAAGRASAPTSLRASAAPLSEARAAGPAVLTSTRDGNQVMVRLSVAGRDPGDLRLARLRLSDGNVLSPNAVTVNSDGSVTVNYDLPSQFGFTRVTAQIELPLGTGVWSQSIDLR